MGFRDERQAQAEFGERYAITRVDTTLEIERRVIGAAWGTNGYTTRAQADEIGRRLQLGPGRRLLDVGAGRGWPGLYLAVETGCDVVGTDMPFDALQEAHHRAEAEGLRGRAAVVAAAGSAQPFRPRSFDAVVLTDVLC